MGHRGFIMWCILLLPLLNMVIIEAQTGRFEFTKDVYKASIEETRQTNVYITSESKMGIYVTDLQLASKIVYTILGDEAKIFKVDNAKQVGDFVFLRIHPKMHLNRESDPSWILQVKAKATDKDDSSLETVTEIQLEIEDVNDLRPIFLGSSEPLNIREDTPVQTTICTVKASDADSGTNADIYYKFYEDTDYFVIHPTSGGISLTRRLRPHREKAEYSLVIEAQDRGGTLSPSKTSTTSIQIKVVEVNYHAPTIKVDSLEKLTLDSQQGKLIAVVTVNDDDLGENGGIRTVTLSGDFSDHFNINQRAEFADTYEITIAKGFPSDLPLSFTLSVIATDTGGPPKSSSKKITVERSNGQIQYFDRKYFEITVSELIPVESPIFTVASEQVLSSNNIRPQYSIVAGNKRTSFQINPSTGYLSAARLLNRERVANFNLTIRTSNHPSHQAYISIKVKDENDNFPVFLPKKYEATVQENLPVNSPVIQVSATDDDEEENGYVSYSIANLEPVPFEIDPFTGHINTTMVLDYEVMRKVFRLHIRASDWGSPFRREAEVDVIIALQGINDNQPMFEKSYCSGTISRDIRSGNQIDVYSAIDFDSDPVNYSIASGNVGDLFVIDKTTGTLSLKRDIQNSDPALYNLKLVASDAPASAGYLWVNVSIINGRNANRNERRKIKKINCESSDALDKHTDMISKSTKANEVVDEPTDDFMERFGRNDFPPVFDEDFPSTFDVLENTPRGSTIVNIMARDRDPGFNGMLVYAISSGNENLPFHLDHNSGVLSVLTPPDRERIAQYDLSITVSDLGGNEAKSIKKDISINILDVNDNSPLFVRESYSEFLDENVDVGKTFLRVAADDRDAGSNGDIRYSIQTDNDNFLIDAMNGDISVSSELDRESIPVHELRVVATDSSESAPLSSTVTVTVTVQDVNDNTPRCIPEEYSVRMLEDLPTRVLVIDVEAIDEDEGPNGEVTYSLKRGGEGKFVIDPLMGTIRLADRLDYETQQVYSLLVEVKDSGSPRKKATCSVQVEVIDVNENAYTPSFGGRYYVNGSVEENVPINTRVMRVTAEDQDGGRDGEVTYSIRNGSGLGRFTIDSEGVIRTASPLDRESAAHYWLTIYAQDKGAVPLHSTIEAYIEILDVNDNSPQPLFPVYYAEVVEKSPVDRSVVQVTAEDLDSSSNQALEFSIQNIWDARNNRVSGVFNIDPVTGLITTLDGNLDREETDGYSLEVLITDNGEPPMSTVAMVIITVTDLNDNKPHFKKSYYSPKIPAKNKTSEAIQIFRVYATDIDTGPNAELSYFITQGNDNQRFSLDAKTGILSTRKALDASVDYPLLSLEVLDTGTPKQKKGTAKISLTVIDPPRNSPTPPEFFNLDNPVDIQETLLVGELIEVVLAYDADEDTLFYQIKDGDPTSTFWIDPNNGIIQLALPLDWEVKAYYDLNIAITDGTHYVEKTLRVNVLDSNDNAPEFDKTEYEVIITENTPVNSNILTVRATDRDSASLLSYVALDNTDSARERLFTVDGRTGTIAVAKPLDHENRKKHTLNIMAQDHGIPTKKAYTRVVIRVTDFNDHAPSCQPEGFQGRVYESAAENTRILQVTAVDLDKGDNAELSYSFESGNPDNDFSMDPAFGYITVGSELDRSKKAFYQMVVRVQDHGVPIKSCTCNVNITVTISNNAPPKFLVKEYMENVYENLPARTPVVVAEAISRSSVVYEIINGNEANDFEVNPSTGVVSTKVPLDYEDQTIYNLTVQATNMVGLSAKVFVIVHVEDVNDNAPEFLYNMYRGNITESKPPNNPVLDRHGRPLVISAQDEDSDHNAHLLYQIIEIEAQKYFTIDANTGAIRSKSLLDHEQRRQFKFTVQVRDSGEPQLQSINPVDVLVTIVDINDSPPVFDSNVYNTLLILPTYKDVAVVTVHATDADTASITSLEYAIMAGDTEKRFSIHPVTGIITVINATNLIRNYALTITVSDGMNKGTAEVQISVQQAQESELRFAQESYSASVIENDPSIKIIALVSAVGNALNEPLQYRVLNPDKMFNISKTSGILRTTGIPFDREAKQAYNIVVEVSDTRTDQRRAHVLVHVEILDENDNVPMFVHVDYKAVVQVEAEVGSIVRKVIAIDHDIGKNGEVKYSLVEGGDNRFNINTTSGEIMLVKKLDPSNQNEDFILKIKASDKGSNKKHSSVVDVPISVINKAMPVFQKPQYSKTIPENIQLHTAILQIQATSPDERKVIYSVSGGDSYNQFVITNKTGALKVVGAMDFETTQEYRLTVRASDTLTGAYAEVIVVITIEDINDIAPLFDAPVYSKTLSEAVAVGTSVANVVAYDYDSGTNGRVSYQIVDDGSMTDSFYIDSHSGSILTSRVLDYESIKNHNFLVRAVDGGMPQLSSVTRVTVKVTDLNDNPPAFTKADYEATISELAGKGAFVCVVAATDPDISDTSKLTYTIISGNDEMNFYIGSKTGIISITNTRQPNLNADKTYILNISVSDMVFTNNAYIIVNVDGTNQYAPTFTMFEYSVSLDENQPIGTSVLKVSATDDDEGTGGRVSYSIIGEDMSSKFIIDTSSGEISTASIFDRENPSQRTMSIPIMAIDEGHRASFSSVKVILQDKNDNLPTFELAKYQAYIYSDLEVGDQVLQVHAVDADKDQNARLTYSIFAGRNDQVTELFQINSGDGSLLLKAPLIGRETDSFQFFVQAVDGGETPLRGDAQVEVYIMNRQDVLPTFVDIIPQFGIMEDAQIGSVVGVVTAIHNETLVYSVVPGNLIRTNNKSKFSVNNKGEVLVNSRLDYETCAWYTLTIKATTDTIPSLASFKEVRVDVKDVNDNAPRFESISYDIKIPENAPVDYSVLRVHAYDKDTTSQIEYSLSSISNDVSDIFSIDSLTGWITTSFELDREKTPSYVFAVIARHVVDEDDEVGANVRSTTTTVQVHVMDVNDSPPRFTSTQEPVTVPEDVEPPYVLIRVSASDADYMTNAMITYHIAGGDPFGQFCIDPTTGKISTKQKLDREFRRKYVLNIKATDGVFFDTTNVTVLVGDVNDNAPVCLQMLYSELVNENLGVSSYIVEVLASDADARDNSRITFTLFGDGADDFEIHPESGILRTAALLDRETQSTYQLKVNATDGGGLSCTSEVLIALIDDNDNPPVFEPTIITEAFSENTPTGSLLTSVQAIDPDEGTNRQFRYSFVDSAGGMFGIDRELGIISLLKGLDRELKDMYNLTIQATDTHKNMSSVAYLVVKVLDEDDNAPIFEYENYRVNVSEDADIGMSVAQVLATSEDIEEITYSITGGNEHGKFNIHPDTGMISVADTLDFEMSHDFFLTIQASDNGQQQQIDIATVNIRILDANDNKPDFSQQIYNAVINEAAQVGDSIVQVMATDQDAGDFGKVLYKIVRQDLQGVPKFEINEKDGLISLAAPVDREQMEAYTVTVRAIDGGSPPLFTDVYIQLMISDINDNSPHFSKNNYTVVIQEETYPITSLKILEVSDLDSPMNGPPFMFEITQGNDEGLFKITEAGILQTAMFISQKEPRTIKIVVRATDSGTPSLSEETYVSVIITESTHPPIPVTPLKITINSFPEYFPAGFIGKVHADDLDSHDELQFGFVSESQQFRIQDDSGKIFIQPEPQDDHYELNVSITDHKFTSYADVFVDVAFISQDMLDNAMMITVRGISPEDFFFKHYAIFKHSLAGTFASSDQPLDASNIKVITIQETKPASQDVDIIFAVQHFTRNDAYLRPKPLVRLINSSKTSLGERMGIDVVSTYSDICQLNTCPKNARCKSRLVQDAIKPATVVSIRMSLVSVRMEWDIECICKSEGECGTPVPPAPALSFSGNSFMRYTAGGSELFKKAIFSSSVRTIQADGIIMYGDGNLPDFSVLEVKDGYLQYRFNCGSGEGQIRITETQINDGTWHQVEVSRDYNRATLTLDGSYTASGSAHGNHEDVNIDQIYVGGKVDSYGRRTQRDTASVANGFQGCMDDINLNGQPLTASGDSVDQSNVGACPLVFPLHCHSNPCQNRGECITLEFGYQCVCKTQWHGSLCEFRDMCLENPCQNGGDCIRNGDDFSCRCSGKNVGGDLCINLCASSLCLNGGTCYVEPSGPGCLCSNYQGDRCELDIDECLSNPCQDDYICFNLPGSFQCKDCRQSTDSDCNSIDKLADPNIKSSVLNFNKEEIIGAGLCIFIIIIIVIIFTIIVRRRRKRRYSDSDSTSAPVTRLDNRHHDYKRDKVSNLDVHHVVHNPPPVPIRPRSYTPSNHNSLNNLNDNERYYDSHDGQNVYQGLPVSQQPSLHPIPSNSDSDSIAKPHWDFDNRSGTGSFVDGKESHHNIPVNVPPIHQPPPPVRPATRHPVYRKDGLSNADLTSMSSINTVNTENEEDNLPGYHWDCSDWMPPTLTKIHEDVTQIEVPDSPTNLSVNTTMSQMNEFDDDVDDEYVGEDTDYPGDDDMPYPHTEEFQQQLQSYPPNMSPQSSRQNDSMSDLPRQYYQHPNMYLPGHHMSATSLPPSEYNGPDQSPRKHGVPMVGVGSRGGDYERALSNMDNGSMSAYTSNASCSDMSAMYEPESEIGLSDCESETDDRFSTHLSNLTTDV